MLKLSKNLIDDIIGKSDNVATAIVDLYKYAIPNWDSYDENNPVPGWPVVSENTWRYIYKKLVEKGELEGFTALQVGLTWMNRGFSGNRDIPDWHVLFDEYK